MYKIELLGCLYCKRSVLPKMDVRYKTYTSGRKMRLCIGNNNTCLKEQKIDNLCHGCRTGFDKTFFLNRKEGEVFTKNNIRYKFIGGQTRHLCIGDDNACNQIRCDGGNLCVGHKNGTVRTPNEGLHVGDMIILNGKRYRFNGLQKTLVCDEILADALCNQSVVKDGKCKTHSPHYKRKYTVKPCYHRRVTKSQYCNRHENNVENPRKFIGEFTIANVLEKLLLVNTEQPTFLGCISKNLLRFDFYILECNLLIEFDGSQHFESIKHWGDEEGLAKCIHHDIIKDNWCINNNKVLLRISHVDIDNIAEIIKLAIEHIEIANKEIQHGGYILATSFYDSICSARNNGIRDTTHYLTIA